MYQNKENFEWISSWCDEAIKEDLPRVLLVGDSICMGYQQRVRELLRGVCYVDYLANTYAVDNPFYRTLFKKFYADSRYDLVHFNHGLHGGHMKTVTYRAQIEKLLSEVTCKICVATSTVVYAEGNKKLDGTWNKLVHARNKAILSVAQKKGYAVDDLYAVSVAVPKEQRNQDGIHYLAEGYEAFSQAVAQRIKEILPNKG